MRRGRAGGNRRGAALLEVVVALSILLIAMGIVGAVFYNSDHHVRRAVDKSRAMMLTDQIITNYDTGQFQEEREASGEFGEAGPPGWSWSFKVQKDTNVEGLDRVTIRIVSKDPEGKSDEETPILATSFLRAEKRNINLMEDLGLSEDQVEQLTQAIPGGEALLDPTNFDPTSLLRNDMDTLQAILPMIMQALGGAAGGLPGAGGIPGMGGDAAGTPTFGRASGGPSGGRAAGAPGQGGQGGGGPGGFRPGGGQGQGGGFRPGGGQGQGGGFRPGGNPGDGLRPGGGPRGNGGADGGFRPGGGNRPGGGQGDGPRGPRQGNGPTRPGQNGTDQKDDQSGSGGK